MIETIIIAAGTSLVTTLGLAGVLVWGAKKKAPALMQAKMEEQMQEQTTDIFEEVGSLFEVPEEEKSIHDMTDEEIKNLSDEEFNRLVQEAER